ncbi:MAG: reverse transcriptase, partial [Erysipelotrichaceae bacterium]|nr:reverse transcriptase [Erysipelotrichaceae bacterium]
MDDYEKIYNFNNLYKAHTVARLGKRTTSEVIDFEMNLASNLVELANALEEGTYEMQGYYSFMVHDPKDRVINALHYRDRVVQHCICDEVLAPALDKRLIYDNAACRIGKGTHFAMKRLTSFLCDFYRIHGRDGYILRCDIRKFFDNIDHEILKGKLRRVFKDERLLKLLFQIIDSYEKTPGKGLPLGNQTSQWFAIYYLDSFDRLIKEKLHIK